MKGRKEREGGRVGERKEGAEEDRTGEVEDRSKDQGREKDGERDRDRERERERDRKSVV